MIHNFVSTRNLVEFVGTYLFLLVVILTGDRFAIAATLGLLIHFFGSISGGNFNPAVTIMMVMAKKQPYTDLIPYIILQILGGCLAYQTYSFLSRNKYI
tara:strand:+ start:7228 stop:7524 length:297 start_codon:yes stop_codon:yes gene_type:complete